MSRTEALCAILFVFLIGFTIGAGLMASVRDWRAFRRNPASRP